MPLSQDPPTQLPTTVSTPLTLDPTRLTVVRMSLTQDPTMPTVVPTPLMEDPTRHTVVVTPLIQEPTNPTVMPAPLTQDPTKLITILAPLTQDNTLYTVILMPTRPDPLTSASHTLRLHHLKIAHYFHHQILGNILAPHSRQNMVTSGTLAVALLSLLLTIVPQDTHRPKHLKSNDPIHRRMPGETVIL